MDIQYKIDAAKRLGYSDKDIQSYLDKNGLQNTQSNSIVNSILKPGGLIGGPGGIDMTKNFIGQTLAPRVSQTYNQIEQGQPVSADQALGAVGEYAGLVAAPSALEGGIIPSILKSGGLGVLHGATTPGASLEQRGQSALTEGLTDAALAGILKVGQKIINPFKSVGEYRAAKIAEAEGNTISGDKMIEDLAKSGKNVSPTDFDSYNKFLEKAKDMYAGKSLTIDEAVNLNSQANTAFTAAGKVGKSSKAIFNKALGDSIKSQLPLDVAKANNLFKTLYGATGVVKKYVVPAAVGAGIGAGIYGVLGLRGH